VNKKWNKRFSVSTRAVQGNLISAEELKARLEKCREQGTHYGVTFIEKIYNMAKQRRREL
jgi:hypothetical protein